MDKKQYSIALTKLNKNYSDAENEIKSLEVFSGELSIPAINELRYAGRHILRASENIDKDCIEAEKEILLADVHCTRALNDVNDASIILFLEEIRFFEIRYGISLYNVLKNYGETRKEVYAAQNFILDNRKKYNERPKFYKESKKHSEKLKRIFEMLNANKEMLEREREKVETENMRIKKRFGITISFAMLSITVILFTTAIKLLFG